MKYTIHNDIKETYISGGGDNVITSKLVEKLPNLFSKIIQNLWYVVRG